MSIIEMQVAQILTGTGDLRAWEYEINLDSDTEFEILLIPDKINIVTLSVSFSGGAGVKIYNSTDRISEVKLGSPVFIEWPFGTVLDNGVYACLPTSAIKIEQIGSGTVKVSVRAQ